MDYFKRTSEQFSSIQAMGYFRNPNLYQHKMYFRDTMRGKFFLRCARITGGLLLGAGVLHSTLGTAEVFNHIKFGDVSPTMISTFKNIWLFSGVMLFLSAAWIFFLARDLGRLQRRAWWQAVLIGLGYSAGAFGAMAWAGIQAHLIAFALIGLLLLVPLLLWARAFSSAPGPHSIERPYDKNH